MCIKLVDFGTGFPYIFFLGQNLVYEEKMFSKLLNKTFFLHFAKL